MEFWKVAYEQGWIGIEMLRQAVITRDNPYGEILKDEYKKITGLDFEEE